MPNSAAPAQQFAQALLLEHIAFIKSQLCNPPLSPNATPNPIYTHQIIDQFYRSAARIELQDVILLEQLQAVVQKYCFELNLGGEILEFIGSAARKIHLHILGNDTALKQLLSDENFEIWLYKILELEQVRYYLREQLLSSPQIAQISLQLANHILEKHTPWLDQLRKAKLDQPGFAGRVFSFLQDQQQNIELKIEQQLAHAILNNFAEIVVLPQDELADIALHMWSSLKHKSLKESFAQFEAIDFEDFFVLLYETWKQLRQNKLIQELVFESLTAFYQHFATSDLQSLLHAVGLDVDDLYEEADRFLPHVCRALDQRGVLDDLLKSMLEPFYLSPRTQQLIQEHCGDCTSNADHTSKPD